MVVAQILENVLLNLMFDLPSIDDVEKVMIDADVITGKSKPLLLYKNIEEVEDEADEAQADVK